MGETLLDILEAAGYQAAIATSGEAALDQTRAQTFDLVLMDIQMPGLNGVETLDAMRVIAPTIPVIFMTAYARSELAARARQEGLALLPKPLPVRETLALIEQTLTMSAPGARPAEPGARVLIVDDDEAMARALGDMLETRGYQPIVALNGEGALAQIAAAPPDVVVCDFFMPRMTAADLYAEIERRYPTLCRRFVLMGGDLDGAPVRAFVDATGVPNFSKGSDLHEVIQVVRATAEVPRQP
jgi:CheY-like chemotaxis protein